MNPNCLQRADDIVHGDRNAAYGEPNDNHSTTAEAFSTFMRRKYDWFRSIDAEDVCWFNISQKISREMNSETADGPVDICGYTANVEIIRNGWKVSEIREQRKPTDAGSEPVPHTVRVDAATMTALEDSKPVQSVHTTSATNPGETVKDQWCSYCGADGHWRPECKNYPHATPPIPIGPHRSPYATVGENPRGADHEESER